MTLMPTDEMKQRIQEMNDLPDISGDDSPELKRLCEQSAREVKLAGFVSAATSLEIIGFMRELEIKQRSLITELERLQEEVERLRKLVYPPGTQFD
jgi:hypothetical protein